MSQQTPEQFVVLPTRGLRASVPTSSPTLAGFLIDLNSARSATAARSFGARIGVAPKTDMRVIDSIHEDGAKLVEMTPASAKELQAAQPGLRIVPVVYYKIARARMEIASRVSAAATSVKVPFVVKSVSGAPVVGAHLVAFTNFEERTGGEGDTNAQGVAKITLGGAKKIERVYVYPKKDFWGAFQTNVQVKPNGVTILLEPVDLSFTDQLRHFYGKSPADAGKGVTVGIVDTGVGPHPDLVVDGGTNTVLNENPTDFGNNGEGHGTHCGGIVAARGTPPAGIRGLAPAVRLRSYRVFGKGAEGAANFAISKAIDAAWNDGCDIINLSLGGGPSDPATQSAVHDAREHGAVVIAAAGNDGRQSVSFPGADPLCVAVSAMGRKGTFPKGSLDDGEIEDPFGDPDKDNFIAAFSNVGPQIDLTGTGVGILSTVPGGYAPMSGTSMASPAVAGCAARLLAANTTVLNMPRDQARSDEIVKMLLKSAKLMNFGADFEGKGLPA